MPRWRNSVSIKKHLTEESSPEIISRLSGILHVQLNSILKKEERLLEKESNRALDEFFLDDFKTVVENFEWLSDVVLTDEDPDEYSFETWEDAFNSYLEELYYLGDTETEDTGSFFDREKFLWVD